MHESLTDDELHALCLRWVAWHRSRRLFAPPVPKNILARMQPSRFGEAPEVELSAELATFNTAVNAQPDSGAKNSFLVFYFIPMRTVKEAAFAQGITRDAFYRRVRRFRRRVYRTMVALEAGNDTDWVKKSGYPDSVVGSRLCGAAVAARSDR